MADKPKLLLLDDFIICLGLNSAPISPPNIWLEELLRKVLEWAVEVLVDKGLPDTIPPESPDNMDLRPRGSLSMFSWEVRGKGVMLWSHPLPCCGAEKNPGGFESPPFNVRFAPELPDRFL